MKISAKNGALIAVAGLIGLFMTFWVSFGDCFKSECNEQAYSISAIISFLILICGLAVLLIGVIRLARSDPSKKIWLILVIALYILMAFGAYYYFLGGNRSFEARSFQSNFKTAYFKVSYLPSGYVELHTHYSSSSTSNVYGPGNYARTKYGKPFNDANGDAHYEEFSLEQGDRLNDAAGILKFCGKAYDCDVIDGKNVKNIHCQRTNRHLCSVELDGTYVSLSGETNLSREESVAILDSLVPK